MAPHVRQSFIASDRTYGARRVWFDMLELGYECGLHRIERLMRAQALRARPRRRGLPQDRGERSVIAGNVLDREFTAAAPNQKWVADFTYIWTAQGWLYVAVVLDLYSRRIVGWSMQDSMTSQLVADALMMAVWRRGKPVAVLHHSDQGSQYKSEQFQRLMADSGIVCSMSRSGNVWDNAAMESFFSSLKTERIARKSYRTRNEAKADVFDYIERFYNPKRRHSTIGYLSPVEFERKWTNEASNRLMMEEFDRLAWESYKGLAPGQKNGPGKTVVFAITKHHAARLAQYLNDLHPEHKGRYAEVITSDVANADDLIRRFKQDELPMVAVSVGMLDTGFDCREVLHLVMCRRVRSPILYQQMRGRGTRTAPPAPDLSFDISSMGSLTPTPATPMNAAIEDMKSIEPSAATRFFASIRWVRRTGAS